MIRSPPSSLSLHRLEPLVSRPPIGPSGARSQASANGSRRRIVTRFYQFALLRRSMSGHSYHRFTRRCSSNFSKFQKLMIRKWRVKWFWSLSVDYWCKILFKRSNCCQVIFLRVLCQWWAVSAAVQSHSNGGRSEGNWGSKYDSEIKWFEAFGRKKWWILFLINASSVVGCQKVIWWKHKFEETKQVYKNRHLCGSYSTFPPCWGPVQSAACCQLQQTSSPANQAIGSVF